MEKNLRGVIQMINPYYYIKEKGRLILKINFIEWIERVKEEHKR